jgi:hypothetical protein
MSEVVSNEAPWTTEHAALVVSTEIGDHGRKVHVCTMGTMIGGDLLETWLILMPIWRALSKTSRVFRMPLSWLNERRVAMEHAWSRMTRFIPREPLLMLGEDVIVQHVIDGWSLVRKINGQYSWRQRTSSVTEPLLAPPEAVFQDTQCSTASNKQAFRRNLVVASHRLVEILSVPEDPGRKRKRALPQECQEVQCTLIGPFAPWSLNIALRAFDTPGVLALHEDVRFYPTPSRDLFGIAFVQSSRAQSGLVSALKSLELPYTEVLANCLRSDLGTECDITLTVDSLDFSGTSLRREYDVAGFAERSMMQPKRASSRFAPLQQLFEEDNVPYTWEAMAMMDQPGRRTVGIERALAGLHSECYDASLHVPHKASRELGEQLFNACLWMGHPTTCPELQKARGILRQAIFDGFYLRTIA